MKDILFWLLVSQTAVVVSQIAIVVAVIRINRRVTGGKHNGR